MADTAEADDWPGTVADEWPGTVVRSRGRGGRGRNRNPVSAAPVRSALTGEAVDGDTLRREAGPSLRLYGADAPEADQQGWDRVGNPVPIGQEATDALASLVTPEAVAGAYLDQSYGRPVATVDQAGQDVGERSIRTGNALAAPQYLKGDAHFAPYMDAERLARQNRLGVHGVYAQTPSDFRHAPDRLPERETVAQWFDTPTPFAGLRPEIERGYLDLQKTGTADQILKYASDNGFTIDPAITRKFVKSRDAKRPVAFEVTYAPDAPKPLTNQGDGAVGAAARGVGDGVLPNMLDEAGAVVDTLGGTDDRESVFNSDRRFADIFANNVDQNRAIIGYDDMAHPYARLAGEVAGGLAVPFGMEARTVPELAKVGAAYGAAAGFGGGETLPERLTGAVVNAGAGAVVTAAGGKLLEKALPKLAAGWRWVRGKGGEPVAMPDAAGIAPDAHAGAPESVPGTSDAPVADAMPMAADAAPVVTQEVRKPDYLLTDRPTRMDAPLTEAQMRATSEQIEPRDVLPIASNEIGSVEEAAAKDSGRIVDARAPDERAALTRRTIRGWNGSEVPKVGPIDLIGFLRLRGGLKDNAGELRSMDFDNRPRKMDFAGQEHRFGPLLNNETGTNLDDAAFNAWEAGYFPDLSERPDTATFLEALRDNHHGQRRNFLPEDLPEVEAHNAMRAERHDLEQQSFVEGAPIYTDRSLPADEPAPFPPVEAYEDWPSGGPDFAGNIRLEKLESPQDIKRALAVTKQRVGFDAATRGKVTHEETNRLAAELGMTPDTLLARRKGQAFNAEEALAARQILAKSGNELVNMARKVQRLENPGDDVMADFRTAWMRHAAIQGQVAGATAEAGRALSQFRMAANSRMVSGEVLAGIVKHGGGTERIKEAADLLLEAAETSPGQFNVMADKLSKQGRQDKAAELYINMLLSGPQTHVVNMVSNTLTALGQIPEHAVAAAIGGARAAVGKGEDRIITTEVGARAFGLLQGVKEGMRQFGRTLKTGEPSDFASKVEAQSNHAISGVKGSIIRTPTRLLSAEDELFKGIARRMELNGLAVRMARKEGLRGVEAKARIADLVANPPDELLTKAFDYGRYLTFQRPVGGLAAGLTMAKQKAPLLNLLVTFVRTPTNLLKFAVERSPGAPLLKEWRRDFIAGGARRDLAMARAMVGTGFGAVMYEAALRGDITGSLPDDEAKTRFMRADGWQPYSFKVGGKYYSYSRLDPFATTIGVAADLATKREGMTDKQVDNYAMLLVASIMKNLGEKTWLSGTTDFLEAMSDPERYGPGYIRKMAGSLTTPSLVNQVDKAIDPVSRVADDPLEAIQSRVPGLSDELPARRDIWGEPIVSEGGVGPDIISPMRQSTAKDDPVNAEMLAIGAKFQPPLKKVTIDGKDVDLSPRHYEPYAELAGRKAKAAISDLMAEPGWSSFRNPIKLKAVTKAVTQAKRDARDELFGGKSASPEPGGADWPGKARSSDNWPGAVVDQPDVAGELQRLIPGLGMTSGFRTPEYQADMRRRGYKPADNSPHLDGSSLDLTPPRGKSMDWLRVQVRRAYPNARFLNEGDHLHTTFPGWFGAPVLGGAKAAGLRNPMAGR